MPSSPNHTRSKVSQKPRPGCASLTEEQMTISCLIQQVREMEKKMRLLKRILSSLLSDRDPTERRPVYVLTPDGNPERVG